MIPADLVELLRCPQSGQTLALADAEILARLNRRASDAGGIRNVAGAAVEPPILAALFQQDRLLLYPVRDGIPILLVEEGIPL